jgi:hypothetical protein
MTQTIGSRRQVMNGTAKKTSGGLTKADLMMSHGHIVSKKKHFSAKKEMRLLKYGYGTQKGKFGFVKIGTKKHHRGHKKMRGGNINYSLSPSGIDGQGITNYNSVGSIGVQEAAGMAGGRSRSKSMSKSMRMGMGMGMGKSMYGGRSRSKSMSKSMGMGMGMGMGKSMYGGSGITGVLSPGSGNWSGDGIAGQGITTGNAGSANIQLLAGMAGGKRRKKMRGGTTSQFNRSNAGFGPQQMALNAA